MTVVAATSGGPHPGRPAWSSPRLLERADLGSHSLGSQDLRRLCGQTLGGKRTNNLVVGNDRRGLGGDERSCTRDERRGSRDERDTGDERTSAGRRTIVHRHLRFGVERKECK
jgi:hypothetical protein